MTQRTVIMIKQNYIILPVLYGCENWRLRVRAERRLRVFENRVLGRMFGPKRDEVTGEWRRLHYEELYALYSPNVIWLIKSRRLKCVGHVARVGGRRGAYRVLVGKPEGRRLLVRPRHRWEDNIKMDSRRGMRGVSGMDWIDLAQGRDRGQAVVNAVKNLLVP